MNLKQTPEIHFDGIHVSSVSPDRQTLVDKSGSCITDWSVGSTRLLHNNGQCDVWHVAYVTMWLGERGRSEGVLHVGALLRDPYPICVHSPLHFSLGFVLLVWCIGSFSELAFPPLPSNPIFFHQTHLFLATTFQFQILDKPKASIFTSCCLLPLYFPKGLLAALLGTQKSSTLFLGYLIQSKIFQLFTYCIISNTRSKKMYSETNPDIIISLV